MRKHGARVEYLKILVLFNAMSEFRSRENVLPDPVSECFMNGLPLVLAAVPFKIG